MLVEDLRALIKQYGGVKDTSTKAVMWHIPNTVIWEKFNLWLITEKENADDSFEKRYTDCIEFNDIPYKFLGDYLEAEAKREVEGIYHISDRVIKAVCNKFYLVKDKSKANKFKPVIDAEKVEWFYKKVLKPYAERLHRYGQRSGVFATKVDITKLSSEYLPGADVNALVRAMIKYEFIQQEYRKDALKRSREDLGMCKATYHNKTHYKLGRYSLL